MSKVYYIDILFLSRNKYSESAFKMCVKHSAPYTLLSATSNDVITSPIYLLHSVIDQGPHPIADGATTHHAFFGFCLPTKLVVLAGGCTLTDIAGVRNKQIYKHQTF